MHILGITNNDLAGASIITDGKVVSAVSEERIIDVKDYNGWPSSSLEYVLDHSSLKITDIDRVCYAWSTGFNVDRHLALYLDRYRTACERGEPEVSLFRERVDAEVRNDLLRRTEFENWIIKHDLLDRVAYVDHHEAHAIGAFALSPFSSGLAVSCDGRGDFRSLAIYGIEHSEVASLYSQSTMDSFGYLYGRITRALGFVANRHEGKILGLAAHGGPSGALDELQSLVRYEDGKITFQMGGIYAPFYDRHFGPIEDFCRRYTREDVAYAMQEVLVTNMVQLIAHYVRKTGLSNVAVGGGVFTNVRLNQRIAELPNVSNLFVLPCMGDGGLPLAASAAFSYRSGAKRAKLESVALGPDVEVRKLLATTLRYDLPQGLQVESVNSEEINETLVNLLVEGGIVGLFRGRSEFGPRALCRRTLLALPSIIGISATLNMRLKRSEFMPFAPVVAANLADLCFLGWTPRDLNSRYMTQTFGCTEAFKASCPEVVHVDETARPQVVHEVDDPFMYRLLNEVYARTGSLALINTSFNVHESPIIGDARQALAAVRDSICDALVIGDEHLVLRRAHARRKEALMAEV